MRVCGKGTNKDLNSPTDDKLISHARQHSISYPAHS